MNIYADYGYYKNEYLGTMSEDDFERQAIQSLEQEGLIIRARGKGTEVSRQEKIEELLASIKSFTEEMCDRNMVPGTRLAEVSRIQADGKLADVFSCEVNDTLYRVRRVRTANGKEIVLFDTYLRSRKELPMDNGQYYGSLYQLLERQGIPHPVGVEEQFEATVADETISKALNISVILFGIRRMIFVFWTLSSNTHG